MDHRNTNGAGGHPPAPAVRDERTDPPILSLTIWPHRSLPRRGFHGVLGFAGAMLAVPLLPLLGTPVGWALLPFLLGTLLLLWFFIERNYRQGAATREDLRLWPDLITVDRHDPGIPVRHWEANPYWVRTELRRDARLENYLTLKGGAREIELGAFLSPAERLSLRDDLDRALGRARAARAPG